MAQSGNKTALRGQIRPILPSQTAHEIQRGIQVGILVRFIFCAAGIAAGTVACHVVLRKQRQIPKRAGLDRIPNGLLYPCQESIFLLPCFQIRIIPDLFLARKESVYRCNDSATD